MEFPVWQLNPDTKLITGYLLLASGKIYMRFQQFYSAMVAFKLNGKANFKFLELSFYM